jgi:ketopantoate reductase
MDVQYLQAIPQNQHKTEIDALTGQILKLAEQHPISVPYNAAI